tara:strand:- start:84 stop:248 length:165 start_codon:yes stop_codon:yes gene_type:complete
MNISIRKFFKKTKVSPRINSLILELVEDYNKEIYKSSVLKKSNKTKIKKNNYSF